MLFTQWATDLYLTSPLPPGQNTALGPLSPNNTVARAQTLLDLVQVLYTYVEV